MALTQISTAGVKDDAVTAGKIPANAVGSSELADNAVDTAAIADDAVTGAKIADDSINSEHFVDGSIDAVHLANNSILTAKIGNDEVTTAKLADDAVTGAKLADNAVVRANITDGEVTSAKLDSNAVTTSKINNNAVTEDKLNSGAVTQTKISDQSIINAKVDNAAAIAGTKISPDFGSQNIETDGEVRTGTYIKTRVAGGGHFYLRNNSTGANYSSHFQTCSGGESSNVQTFVHYYHGGYAELLHQGTSVIRTLGTGVQFRNGGNVSGQLTPNGLCFGSDTAAANALDDYEEGNWTPTITGGNHSISSTHYAKYVKIGKLVQLTAYFGLNAGTGNTNAFVIGGLPFNSASNAYSPNAIDIGKGGKKGAYARVTSNGTHMDVLYSSESLSAGRYSVKGNEVSGDDYIILAASYHVA